MTDLEISKALALAIGWKTVSQFGNAAGDVATFVGGGISNYSGWREFDYRDWKVAGPIAERYDAFPNYYKHLNGWSSGAVVGDIFSRADADTPQKAIALAVIQGAKK
jgi:hypothetical protein